MTDETRENILKSAWHAGIAGVGLYELINPAPKSRLFKLLKGTLAVGLIAFHADAGYCDWRGTPTLLQRILYKLR